MDIDPENQPHKRDGWRRCLYCGERNEQPRVGRSRKYCSPECSWRFKRLRIAESKTVQRTA